MRLRLLPLLGPSPFRFLDTLIKHGHQGVAASLRSRFFLGLQIRLLSSSDKGVDKVLREEGKEVMQALHVTFLCGVLFGSQGTWNARFLAFIEPRQSETFEDFGVLGLIEGTSGEEDGVSFEVFLVVERLGKTEIRRLI